MSKIDKLSILGVRSFSNTTSEVIQLYSPLTLIVGLNGTGKSSIVESLKFSCTGILPPNAHRNGAFIQDPALCGEKEVLAQVKMSFVSTTGARMVATRNLQLTVKKTTRSQKTLEGSLLMLKEGERTSISTRVAELDTLLPQYLGVSKAVLDNVIFCHQEESLWPLSEPAVLKKKFDEIFEALKYTKAIDNIKQLRKRQGEELGKFKIIEQNAKENKDRADKAEKRSRELSEEIEALREEREALHAKAVAVGTKAEDAWTNAARFTEIMESLKSAWQKKKWHETQRNELQAHLEERSEPDEYLRSEIEHAEERQTAQQKARDDKARQYEAVMKDLGRARNLQSDKREEAGRLEQQKASHEGKIRERETAVQSAAREHNIRGYETELDDMQTSEFMDRIARLSKEQTARVDRAQSDNAEEMKKVQEVIVELRESRSTLLGSKNSANDAIDSNKRKIKAASKEIETLIVDEASRADVDAKVAELQIELQSAEQRLVANDSSRIHAIEDELQTIEVELTALSGELMESTKHAGDLARLEHLQKETKNRQRSLKTQGATYGKRLQSLVGHDWEPASLEKDYQTVMDTKRTDVTKAERERDAVKRQLEQIEYKLKLARTELKTKRDELQDSARLVQEKAKVDPDQYLDTLADNESDRDTFKGDVENFRNVSKYFQEAIEIVSTHNMCRLCKRGFDDKKSAKQFTEDLRKLLSSKEQKKVEKKLQQVEEYLPKCREARTSYDTWKRLSEKDVPDLEKKIATYEQEREKELENLESHDRVVGDAEDSRQKAEILSKPVSNIAKCKDELDSYQEQIKELAPKQDASQSRSVDEVHKQLESHNSQAKQKRQELAKLQRKEQSLRDEVSKLEIKLNSKRTELAKIDHELEKKAGFAAQITELEDENQSKGDIINNTKQQLAELGLRMSEETKRLKEVESRNEQRVTELQRGATNLMDTLRDLERIHKEVQRYVEQGGPSQLARCQREIDSFGQEIESHEAEARQITIQINEMREELDKKDRNKRIILDNLSYRTITRSLATLDEEISRLAGQNAEEDQEHHRSNAERFQKEHMEALAQESSVVGRMKVKDDQLLQLLEDWNTDYKDAAPAYKKAHIEVETTKAAIEDLGRYGSALDKAIMKYHTLKMEEINRIVEELWRRTYQGADVDTILIRSDNETAKGNRSYNYRVCMVKQDAEMDMRGRCSAGQKVLASIIIRLALAECFGVNCGIIALDEPTTNLDRDNISSLAESLHHIIRQRRQQRNFQLIVITHDEEFLRAIKPAEFCDHYYRVSRNDRQKSIIERQSIAEVL